MRRAQRKEGHNIEFCPVESSGIWTTPTIKSQNKILHFEKITINQRFWNIFFQILEMMYWNIFFRQLKYFILMLFKPVY